VILAIDLGVAGAFTLLVDTVLVANLPLHQAQHGVTSMFRFGEAVGALYGLIVGLGLPVTFVTLHQWQRSHRVGAAPDPAGRLAVQLYPTQVPLPARKRTH
jgi:hypothetical protein